MALDTQQKIAKLKQVEEMAWGRLVHYLERPLVPSEKFGECINTIESCQRITWQLEAKALNPPKEPPPTTPGEITSGG